MPALDEILFTQNGVGSTTGYSARGDRRFGHESVGQGVLNRGDLRVSFSAGLTVLVAPGSCYVRSRKVEDGNYRLTQLAASGNESVVLDAADGTNPRIDRIVAVARDSAEDTSGQNDPFVTFVKGTPTAGADLNNLNGAAAIPSTYAGGIILADVQINAGNSPALSAANIRDRRPFAIQGVIPPISSDLDMVGLIPAPGLIQQRCRILGASHGLHQSAALFYNPRRIPATHVRWKYQQSDVAANVVGTGQSYKLAICDASGRLVAETAATAFRGGVNAMSAEVAAFSPALPAGTYIEVGDLYVFFGITGLGAAQEAWFNGVTADTATGGNGFTPAYPNLFFRRPTGGAVFPAEKGIIAGGLTDTWNETVGGTDMPVPSIALSVG